MFERHLIEDGSLATDEGGFAFELRLNWYRALPLSSVELTVRVDGEEVPAEAISFEVDGERYALEELREQWERMWFIADPAVVRVEREGGLAPGPHELRVTLSNRIPYIPLGTDVLLQEDTCTKTLAV